MKIKTKVILSFLPFAFFALTAHAQKPSPKLLTPTNHTVVLIDFESQIAFATKNIDIGSLHDNVGLITGGSKIFNVPT